MKRTALITLMILVFLLLSGCIRTQTMNDMTLAKAVILADENDMPAEQAKEISGQALRTLGTIKYIECKDSDNGNDPATAGDASVIYTYNGEKRSKTYNDICSNAGLLREHYCVKEKMATAEHKCEYKCSDGRCTQ